MPAITISLRHQLYLKLGNKAQKLGVPFSTMIGEILRFYNEVFDEDLLDGLTKVANEKSIDLSELVNQLLKEKLKELK